MQEEQTVVDLINDQTCPVRIDITDSGFPEGVPALRWHEDALSRNPWIRRRFGHFALIDAFGRDLLCVSYGERELDQLAPTIAAYRQDPPAASDTEGSMVAGSEVHESLVPEHLRQGTLSRSWMTAYELSYDHWLDVVDLLADGSDVAPGVRNAAIHSLGDYLCAPHPAPLVRLRGIGMRKRGVAGQPARGATPADRLKSGSLTGRAAIALVRIADLPYAEDDDDLTRRVRRWWSHHRDDAEFRIVWSEDPSLRYSFLKGPLLAGCKEEPSVATVR